MPPAYCMALPFPGLIDALERGFAEKGHVASLCTAHMICRAIFGPDQIIVGRHFEGSVDRLYKIALANSSLNKNVGSSATPSPVAVAAAAA